MGRWGPDLIMLGVTAVWALNNAITKVALTGWVSPGAFNAVRFSLGALLLAGMVLATEGSLRLPPRLLGRVALLGLLGNAVNQVCFINGLARTGATNAGIWSALSPLLVAVLSALLRQDRVTPRLVVGALLSAGGILLVLSGQGGGIRFNAGDLLLAASILVWAGYTVFSRPLVQAASPLRVTAVAMLCGAGALVVTHLPALARQDLTAVPAASWWGLLYAAAFSNALGYGLYLWCIRRIGPARVALFNNLGPILTAAGARLILGEAWHPRQWLGAVLVIAGVLVARWDDFRLVAATPPRRAAG